MFQCPLLLKVNVCIVKLQWNGHAKRNPRAFGQERKIERLEGTDGENSADEVAVGTIEQRKTQFFPFYGGDSTEAI
jgi:hypothetical protein